MAICPWALISAFEKFGTLCRVLFSLLALGYYFSFAWFTSLSRDVSHTCCQGQSSIQFILIASRVRFLFFKLYFWYTPPVTVTYFLLTYYTLTLKVKFTLSLCIHMLWFFQCSLRFSHFPVVIVKVLSLNSLEF